MQLGQYAEYYAKIKIASYCFDVYTYEVDDHGIDFIAKAKDGKFLAFQVKSMCKTNYVFMQKTKWNIDDPNTFLVLLLFEDGKLPETYLIPAIAWKIPNKLLCDKDYEGLKSNPEYGLNLSKANMPLLHPFKLEEVFNSFL
jgi:hypothetical protein